jgi:putative membrane protein
MNRRSSKPFLLFVMTAAVIALGFGSAGARPPECEGPPQLDRMAAFGFISYVKPECDRHFVRKAEDGYMLEAALGERAAERAASADIQRFGRMMANCNTFAGNRLMEIAKNNDLEVHTDMDREDREAILHLSKMEGPDFDREYMNQVIKDQEDNVKLFEQMAKEVTNPDLKCYAQQTIPLLRRHLQMARDIYGKIEGQG